MHKERNMDWVEVYLDGKDPWCGIISFLHVPHWMKNHSRRTEAQDLRSAHFYFRFSSQVNDVTRRFCLGMFVAGISSFKEPSHSNDIVPQ